MENIARQVNFLSNQGIEVVIVTSGAVAIGKKGLTSEASSIFGQARLMNSWYEKLGEIGHLLLTDNHLVHGLGSILREAIRCGVLDRDGKTIETLDSKTEIVIFDESKKVSNGGIKSKVQVAREFSGKSIIANGRAEDVILKVAQSKKVGTLVKPIQSSFLHQLK